MTPRAARLLELAMALRQARAQASRLEAELGELVERPRARKVRSLGGGSGTPAAEEDVGASIASPPPAEGSPFDGENEEVLGAPSRPLRRTEELPPLEAAAPTCACGCGGLLPRGGHRHKGGAIRFLQGHASRVRSPESRARATAKAAATMRGQQRSNYVRDVSDPARLDELRRQIADGTYVPFAALRREMAR